MQMSCRHFLQRILRLYRHVPILLCLFVSGVLRAQAPVNYNDVVVIVNDNSDTSKAVGAYFVKKRNIPARNVIHIKVPPQEQIDSLTFESLRRQVEAYLLTNKMKDTINYLVTTKGMPLAVYRSGTNASSVESDLMLILGVDSDQIGQNSWFKQPYFSQDEHFSHAAYDYYLVTRLDGYTTSDIYHMIDNSGPNTFVDQSQAEFVLDEDPTFTDTSYNYLNVNMADVAPVLRDRGWKVLLDSTTVYVTHQQHVIGYTSWGSNDHQAGLYTTNAKPMNTWLPGSIGETYVSTGGRSFQPGTGYGQSLIADWIAEGDPKMSIITHIPNKPTPTTLASTPVCFGDAATLTANDTSHGAHNWFSGAAYAVQDAGPPYDEHNPRWVGRGVRINTIPKLSGAQTYTYSSENITGVGFAQVTVNVMPRPQAKISLSVDTVAMDSAVSFGNLSQNASHFAWDFGDHTLTDTARTPEHRYIKAGKYIVQLTASNGTCDTTVEDTLTIISTASVHAIASNTSFVVSPNPSSGNIHFHLQTKAPTSVSYRMTDVTGRTLLTAEAAIAMLHDVTIEFLDHPAGTYFLEVQTDKETYRQKIVITR